MQKKTINLTPGGWAQACHVTAPSQILLISGQVPAHADGAIPADIDGQCRAVWANIQTQLTAAGMTYANLAKLNIILTDRAYVPAMVAVRNEIFNDEVQPAVTTIIAGLFDERWMIEIEAIAVA